MPKIEIRGHLNIDKDTHKKALLIARANNDTLTNVVEQYLKKYIAKNAKKFAEAIDY